MNNNDEGKKINITEEGMPTINIVNENETEPVINISVEPQKEPSIKIEPASAPQTNTNVVASTPVNPVPQTNINEVTNNIPTTPQINTEPQSPVIPNNVVSEANKEENEPAVEIKEEPKTDDPEEETLGDKLKRILLVVFLVCVGIFVFFLPNISEYFNGVRSGTYYKENVVENGYLKCTRNYDNDASSTEYEYLLNFKNKSLTDGTYTTTYENEDDKKVSENNEKCKKIEEIAQNVNGIDVACSISNNISTTTQNNIFRDIKTGNLTAFTEAGGIYPEYKYGDDIYGIESKLVKAGYDCDVSANSD